jgi:hypothetical protein
MQVVRFEEFVERANRARNTEELVTEFLNTVKQHGLDRMVFCLQTRHRHLDVEPGFGVLQNYPEDWMKHYREKGFDRIDPVTTYCLSRMETFTWAEIPQRMQMSRKQFQCLNMGIEAGLYNGICTPLWGPNQFAGIGLASKEKRDSFDGNLDLITAHTVYEAAHAGDKIALDVVKETAAFLGAGVANLLNTFNPDVVVIAGGVTQAGEALFEPLRAEARRRAFRPAFDACRIVPGELDGAAGVVGAVATFRQQHPHVA